MANTSYIFGLRYMGSQNANTVNGGIRAYGVPASDGTALFIGDAVKSTGTSVTLADGSIVPGVIQAAAGDTLRGVVIGFGVNPNNLNQLYRSASTLATVYVCDDPWAIFEIQTNGTGAITDVGANADIVVGSGSIITGLSGMQLNEASVASSSAQLRIIRSYPVVDNTTGASQKYIVMINEHELKSTTGV